LNFSPHAFKSNANEGHGQWHQISTLLHNLFEQQRIEAADGSAP